MNETRFAPTIKKSMWQTLKLVSRIEGSSRWRLFNDETAGWHVADGRGDHYDGADETPWSRDEYAAWKALEESTDPADVALVERIRERIRGEDIDHGNRCDEGTAASLARAASRH